MEPVVFKDRFKDTLFSKYNKFSTSYTEKNTFLIYEMSLTFLEIVIEVMS